MSVLKPRRSHQRMYMRRSISAQSFASVPPAPGLMWMIAFARSAGPESMRCSSALRTRFVSPGICPSASSMHDSSFSLAPSSRSVLASSTSPQSFWKTASVCSSPERLRVTACAFCGSSQKPGASVDSPRRSISFFSLAGSKMPP